MTTLLTDNGWVNRETGEDLGTWDDEADIVDEGDKIVVYRDVVANTLGGDDVLIGSSELGVGIKNFGTIQTVEGKDTITGNGGLAGKLRRTQVTFFLLTIAYACCFSKNLRMQFKCV